MQSNVEQAQGPLHNFEEIIQEYIPIDRQKGIEVIVGTVDLAEIAGTVEIAAVAETAEETATAEEAETANTTEATVETAASGVESVDVRPVVTGITGTVTDPVVGPRTGEVRAKTAVVQLRM